MVHAALHSAGEAGLSLRELEVETGLRYRVLHNVTWRLEQQGRAQRLAGVRPIRYVASTARQSVDDVAVNQLQNARGQRCRASSSDGEYTNSMSAGWAPHPDNDARRASAVQLAESVLAAEGLTLAHRREALSLGVWFYTEADGKWNTRWSLIVSCRSLTNSAQSRTCRDSKERRRSTSRRPRALRRGAAKRHRLLCAPRGASRTHGARSCRSGPGGLGEVRRCTSRCDRPAHWTQARPQHPR